MKIVTDIDFLHQPCSQVDKGEDIDILLSDLKDTLKEFWDKGYAVAANQIGDQRAIFIMRSQMGWAGCQYPIILINPHITKSKGSDTRAEGCLSLPGIQVKVTRPTKITVEGLNQYFIPVRQHYSGIWARCVCHEIDHLEGKLITDYGEGVKK